MPPRITTASHDASAVLFYVETMCSQEKATHTEGNGYRTGTHIPDHLPDILQRLNIDPKHFIYLSQHFESPFKNLVGNAYHVKQACNELSQQWVHGIRQCEKYFPSS